MFDLHGKTALVTGASGGIGREIALALHAAGAVVAISGTRREVLETLAGQLSDRAHVFPCDLADKEQIGQLARAADEKLGGVDILVNNAGVTRDGLFLRMSDEDWLHVLNVDLTSAFRLSRALLRGMLRKRFGRIIGIGSVVGVTGNAGQSNYAAAKSGMVGMTKSLAAEVATRGVTVNCVAPGFIETPMTDALTEQQKEAILRVVPAGRLGRAEEVAAAVRFLASDQAAYVTGQTLHVNGGMAMV